MGKKTKLYIALVLLSLLWGSNFLLTSILLRDFGVWFIVFFRCLIGALGLLFLLLILKVSVKVHIKKWGLLFLVAVTGGIIPWNLMTYSQKVLTSFHGGLINATTPMWFVILSYLFFKIKLNKFQLIGLLIGFSGVIYLFRDSLFGFNLYSIILALIASLFYALTLIISREYLYSVNNLIISFYTIFLTGLVCGVIVLFQEDVPFHLLTSQINIISFLLLGLFSSGAGYILFFYLAKEGDRGFASYVTYLIPVVAMILGVIFLDEKTSINLIIGSTIILFGIVLTEKTSKQTNR